VAYQPVKQLTLRLDYTYTEATDDVLHEELLRRPKHKGNLNATWQATQALLLNASVLTVSAWVDGNRDFSIPRLDAPGYTTVNLAASFDLSQQLPCLGASTISLTGAIRIRSGFCSRASEYCGIRAKL